MLDAVEPLAHRRGHVDGEVAHHELLEVGERLAFVGREVGEGALCDAVARLAGARRTPGSKMRERRSGVLIETAAKKRS